MRGSAALISEKETFRSKPPCFFRGIPQSVALRRKAQIGFFSSTETINLSQAETIMPVEQLGPGLDRIVSHNEEVEWLGSGYGGVDERGRLLGVAEGPVWWKAGG